MVVPLHPSIFETSVRKLTVYGRPGGGFVLKVPPRLLIGEVFSLSVGSQIMVAPGPVLADALPYLSNSGIIRNVI